MKNWKLTFTVWENGHATLFVDDEPLIEVDESSGLDEAMRIFNKSMMQRSLSYRLESCFSHLFDSLADCS